LASRAITAPTAMRAVIPFSLAPVEKVHGKHEEESQNYFEDEGL